MPEERGKALAAEHQKIRDGIVAVTMAWSAVEGSMAILLSRIIRDEQAAIASAIFFSPHGIEGRVSLVDRALRALLYCEHPDPAHILKRWGSLLAELRRLRETRNRVAHGAITLVAQGGENHIRLTPSPVDFVRMEEDRRKGQKMIPGLSGNDLEVSANAVWAAVPKIDQFVAAIPLVHARDYPALLEKFPRQEPEGQCPDTR